jgi:hypothetical protein
MMKDEDETGLELQPSDGGGGTEEMMPSASSSKGHDAHLSAKKRASRKPGKEGRDPTKRKLRKKKSENTTAVLIKYAALFLLVAQMVGLVLLMRYSRTSNGPPTEEQPLYLASTAVFVMEVMKLVICCAVIAYQSEGTLLEELNAHVINAPMEMLKLSIPSFLYTVQNNLLYLALTYLDAATYQVCYQLKILTTAIFSMVLLGVSLFFGSLCFAKSAQLMILFEPYIYIIYSAGSRSKSGWP